MKEIVRNVGKKQENVRLNSVNSKKNKKNKKIMRLKKIMSLQIIYVTGDFNWLVCELKTKIK